MKAKTILVGLAASFLVVGFAFATATEAHASVRICNKSHSRVNVAIAYRGGVNEGFITEGWWILDVQECNVVYGGSVRGKWVGYYIRSEDGTRTWSGPYTLCANPSARFKILNADRRDALCPNTLGFLGLSSGSRDDEALDIIP